MTKGHIHRRRTSLHAGGDIPVAVVVHLGRKVTAGRAVTQHKIEFFKVNRVVHRLFYTVYPLGGRCRHGAHKCVIDSPKILQAWRIETNTVDFRLNRKGVGVTHIV